MKKLLFCFFVITASAICSYGQSDPTEKKISLNELKTEYLNNIRGLLIDKTDCRCDNNLLRDGAFGTPTINPGGSDINSNSPVWKKGGTTSPQYSKVMGACDSGFVSMWGNRSVGEYVFQTGLNIQKDKCYRLRFKARRIQTNTSGQNPYVQLGVLGSVSNSPGSPFTGNLPSIVSAQIANTDWESYSINFTASASFTTLSLFPVNGNAQYDGNYVSWLQLDNVCLQECCKCGEWKGFAYNIYQKGAKEENITPSGKEGKILSCGKTIVIKSGSTLKLNALYNCAGDNCTAIYTGTIFLPNGSSQPVAGPVFIFNQSQPGYYIISVTPACGDNACPPCKIRVFVTPGCNGDIITDKEFESAVLAGEGKG